MREKINSFIEEAKSYYYSFSSLPDPVRMFISAALFITLGFGIISGVRSFLQNRKIERLETENSNLSVQIQDAYLKQRQAEANAANEAIHSKSLEDKIKNLEPKEKLTDEKIITSQKNSDRLSDELHRVRVSSPANSSTDELEQKICQRYGNCK